MVGWVFCHSLKQISCAASKIARFLLGEERGSAHGAVLIEGTGGCAAFIVFGC
jgi:hypothetical protein